MQMAKLEIKMQALRESRGLTQDELAEMVGTTGPQINRLEKGQRKLTVEWLLRLCAAFNVSADKIVNIPMPKKTVTNSDPAMLGAVVGWLIEACDKYRFKPDSKDVGKWASFVYGEVTEKDLNFKETRELAFHIAKLGKPRK
jgi:transcriptional regulator with XRE-family HTH domain